MDEGMRPEAGFTRRGFLVFGAAGAAGLTLGLRCLRREEPAAPAQAPPGIPALAAPLLLGGIAGTHVLAVVGVLLLTAVYLGMIGLLVSAMMHRSYRAIIVTYAVLLVICFLLAVPAWPISRNMMSRGTLLWQDIMHVLASLSPLEAMMSVIWKMGYQARPTPSL